MKKWVLFSVLLYCLLLAGGAALAAPEEETASRTPTPSVTAAPPTAAPTATAPDESGDIVSIDADDEDRPWKRRRKGSGQADVRFGQSLTVEADETHDKDIVVFGGSARVLGTHRGDLVVFGGAAEIAGTQEGDLVIFGGGASVSGTIKGNVVCFGGGVHMKPTARLEGDVALMGGGVDRDEGAVVTGKTVGLGGGHFPLPGLGGLIPVGLAGLGGLGVFGTIVGWLKTAVVALLLGLVIVALLPTQVEAASVFLQEKWLACLGTGLLAALATIPLTLILLVTCVGAVLPYLFYKVASFFGMTVLFIVVGQALARVAKHDVSGIAALLVGFLVLSLVGMLLPVWWVYGWIAVGCALLTRFGTMKPWFNKKGPGPAAPAGGEPLLPPTSAEAL
jgi:hypothetical protein